MCGMAGACPEHLHPHLALAQFASTLQPQSLSICMPAARHRCSLPRPGGSLRLALLRRLLEQQKAENGGAWPETVAVVLWGTDNIKTYGESLAQVLP